MVVGHLLAGSGSVDGGGNGTFNGGNGSLGGGSSGPVSGKMARMMRRVSDALTFSNPSSRSSPSGSAGPRPGHSPSASPGAGGGGAGGTGGGGGGVIADHHHGSSSRIESSNRINNGGGSNFDINDRDHYTATNHSHKSDNDHSNNHEKKVAGLLTISHMSASNLVMTAGWGTRKVNPYHSNSPRIDHSHPNSPPIILAQPSYILTHINHTNSLPLNARLSLSTHALDNTVKSFNSPRYPPTCRLQIK